MKCGLGNWNDVAEHYVKNKSKEQCEQHYFSLYYKGKEDNLPDMTQ